MIKVPKKWRELPKKERLRIPKKIFKLDEKEIERIRKIKDSKRKLIEAARLQFESFNDIHSYLTVWIAGYGSDGAIRNKFGSTQNLLNLFFKKIKFPEEVVPSWADVKRRVKIPERMNEELAEETGIHIGDGNLYIVKDKKRCKSYRYGITGDLKNEEIYHIEHIAKLMKGLYNLSPCVSKREKKNCVESWYKSKAVVEFKNKTLDLPIGPKKNIKIPKDILKDEDLQKKCVVGIIDTDFSITSSISITGKMNNLHVIKEMAKIFDKNKINYKLTIYKDYGRFYINKKGAVKIIEEWNLKNIKHLSKYWLFNEFKKYVPFSTTTERLAVLNGKLDIKELKKLCKKRASVRAP